MRGPNVMAIGSVILLFIVLFTPREYLLSVAIPFIVVEVSIATYFIIRDHKRRKKCIANGKV